MNSFIETTKKRLETVNVVVINASDLLLSGLDLEAWEETCNYFSDAGEYDIYHINSLQSIIYRRSPDFVDDISKSKTDLNVEAQEFIYKEGHSTLNNILSAAKKPNVSNIELGRLCRKLEIYGYILKQLQKN